MFYAEVYAIARALPVLEQRQENGRRYTVFVNSTSAVDRVRADHIGPGQTFAVAATEGCTKIIARDNEVTIRWVPAHHGAPGNEKAYKYTKAVAEGTSPDSKVPGKLQ